MNNLRILPAQFYELAEAYGLRVISHETSPTFEGEAQYLHIVSVFLQDEYYSSYYVNYSFVSCGNYFRILNGSPEWWHMNEVEHKLKAFVEFYGIGLVGGEE